MEADLEREHSQKATIYRDGMKGKKKRARREKRNGAVLDSFFVFNEKKSARYGKYGYASPLG